MEGHAWNLRLRKACDPLGRVGSNPTPGAKQHNSLKSPPQTSGKLLFAVWLPFREILNWAAQQKMVSYTDIEQIH